MKKPDVVSFIKRARELIVWLAAWKIYISPSGIRYY